MRNAKQPKTRVGEGRVGEERPEVAKKELSERDLQVVDTLEKVIYQRLNFDGEEPYSECHSDTDNLTRHDGELIGVYKLSHYARVKTIPEKATLTTVRAK